jgi:hypothetical protein
MSKNESRDPMSVLIEEVEAIVHSTLDTSGRNTPRTTLYHRVVVELGKAKGEKAEQAILLCTAFAAQHMVDRVIKRRSDLQIPTMKQICLFTGKDELLAALTPIVHESGDGAVTPFSVMLMDDIDDELARETENARRVMERLTKKAEVARRVRPFVNQGMDMPSAFVTLWEQLRAQEPPAAAAA